MRIVLFRMPRFISNQEFDSIEFGVDIVVDVVAQLGEQTKEGTVLCILFSATLQYQRFCKKTLRARCPLGS